MNDQPASVVPLVLVDHETVFREGLQALIGPEPDIVVVGQAGTVRTAEELAVEPHVVVTDLELPDAAPDQVVTRLQRHFPDAAIIALTALDDLTTVRRALAAGANGYLLKSAEATDLFAAIRTVTQGGQYLQPSIEIALALRQPDEYTMLMVGGLSPKETEVLRVLAHAPRIHIVECLRDRELSVSAILERIAVVRRSTVWSVSCAMASCT